MNKTRNNFSSVINRISNIFPQVHLSHQVILFLLIVYAVSIGLLIFFTQFGALLSGPSIKNYEVGSVAEENVVVEQDIVYKDEKATELKKQASVELVPPVYEVKDDITRNAMKEFHKFVEIFRSAYQTENSLDNIYLQIQSDFPEYISKAQLKQIFSVQNVSILLEYAKQYLRKVMEHGIVDLSEGGGASSGTIEIWRWAHGEREKVEMPVSEIITEGNIESKLRSTLVKNNIPGEYIQPVVYLVSGFIEKNCFYNEEETQRERMKVRNEVDPVMKKLHKGEHIVKEGFIITEEDINQLKILEQYSKTFDIKNFIGASLYIALLFILGVSLFEPPLIQKKLEHLEIYVIAIILLVYYLIALVLVEFIHLPEQIPYSMLFPTALVAMVGTVLFNRMSGIIMTLLSTLIILPLTGINMYAFLFAFLSGIAGTAVVSDTEKRIDLIRASIILSFFGVLVALLFGLLNSFELGMFVQAGGVAFANGFFCGILTIGLLPIFEHILNTPTRFRLMELSDLNAPIMKRMLTLAPGTYSHSVSVANLSESAAREIGANELLARVGSYYHDIGKIDQAEYFIENQNSDYNKHNDLKPNLSAAVIKSHVKIGVEKAKSLGLPKAVIDIVAQHHGNGVISYFYQRALRENSEVTESDFSYTGTPPTSKEAAIVMLADAVEAASRTLKKATMAKLEKFVWEIIMSKFNNNQLNDSELTFKDLEKIKKSFITNLAGHFHSRIEYPKTDKEEV